jgi:SAM-dependent methyltransferase
MVGTTGDWDDYLAGYHQRHPGITEAALDHARHPVHGSAYEWLAAAVPEPAGDVVDLASGSSPMQPRIRYRSYLGVEQSRAERDAASAAGRGPVVAGDVTDLQLPHASADTIVMSMALMLVDVPAALAQVARVLRPGGTFAATVPAVWPIAVRDLPALVALSAALRGPGSMPRRVTARSLRRDLHQVDLQVTTVSRLRFPFGVATAGDARLAVQSLYTPGRTAGQLRRAESRLSRLPGSPELPVPLLRVTARKHAAR